MKPYSNQYGTLFEIAMKYLGILMALIYVTAGMTILLRPQDVFNLSKPYSMLLGIGLMTYGLFRGYRLYHKYFKKSS
jgi:hypothetical protein